jgi:Methyltransferase domain
MYTLITPEQSHAHCIEMFEQLNLYPDFIDNIETVADMGCYLGNQAAWWANLTDLSNNPRNIKVNAVDYRLENIFLNRSQNINYYEKDFTQTGLAPNSQDFVFAHNSLQYSLSPIHTLSHWWEIMKDEAMLMIAIPYNFNISEHKGIQNVNMLHTNQCYFNWSLGTLIMTLILSGFDCRNSHFKVDKINGWIMAAVYKLPNRPDQHMNWYEMYDKKLLPLSIEQSIYENGTFNECDLVVEWIDRSQYILRV